MRITMNSPLMVLPMIAFFVAVGCASATPAPNDGRPCMQHFTEGGSFFSGKSYKTYQEFSGVSKAQAVERVTAYLAADGWQINNASKDLGIVSASTTVSYGEGKTAPLNAAITETGSTIRVQLSYQTSGGVTSPGNAVRDTFCKIMEDVGR